MRDLRSQVASFVSEHLPAEPKDIRAPKIIHDSVWGTVCLKKHEVALLDTPLIQRLRRVHQTSFAYLTYPSAVHTRFEHSLGCLHLAAKFVDALRERDSEAKTLVTEEVERNVRAAALLHDVGHGPFSHCSEEIYSHLPQMEELRAMGAEYEGVAPHEVLSCLIVTSDPFREFLSKINDKFGLSLQADRIAAAIAGDGTPETQFEIDIINGPFDVDKLDYVMRDGRLIGLPIAVDLHRLFTAMDVTTDPAEHRRKLTVDLRGEITLEQIIFGKMTLFSSVYQHHKARACDCLLKGVFEYVRNHDAPLTGGNRLESPADFLSMTDDVLAQEGQRIKTEHPILHDLLHGLAYRRLPKRALAVAPDFVMGNWKSGRIRDFFDLRFNTSEHRRKQRELAQRILAESKVDCPVELVWLDLPKPPSLKEGVETATKLPGGELCMLNELFGVDQWAEHYEQHKWMGHVFAPAEHVQSVSQAARSVLDSEYGLKLKPISWQICHLQ